MTEVFADTFYWVAFTNIRDTAHERAKAFMRAAPPRLILTTEEVLTEYLNYFAARGPEFRRTATTNLHSMRASRTVRIVSQSMASFQAGLMLYQSRPDKGYSLVDCISMQTMREEGLTEILTNDRHFEQEGFRALFRDS
jgi:predicted nucleic acid-binding protein